VDVITTRRTAVPFGREAVSLTRSWYLKTTLEQMKLGVYRLVRDVQTGMMKIPAGSIVRIVGKGGGLIISGPKCNHCGVHPFARKVDPGDLELVG
jgi:hypothetical protein